MLVALPFTARTHDNVHADNCTAQAVPLLPLLPTKAVHRFRGESPQSFIFCYFFKKKPLICVNNYKSFRNKNITFFSRN